MELGHTVLGFSWRLGGSDDEVTQSWRRMRLGRRRHGVWGSRVPLRESRQRDRARSFRLSGGAFSGFLVGGFVLVGRAYLKFPWTCLFAWFYIFLQYVLCFCPLDGPGHHSSFCSATFC